MKRLAFSGIILLILGCLGFYTFSNNIETPQGLSFETFFKYLGQPVKTLDRSLTRVIGVNAKDERELGDYLFKHVESMQVEGMLPEKAYVNGIIKELEKQYNPKELNYRVIVARGEPNAFALAGGIIVITTGMLDLLKTEAQLVAILGHEKGHIDLGHCIDHMRLQAKTYQSSFGTFFDWYLSLMLNHTFSKFQENESDRFGFETLQALRYDPSALGESFSLMLTKYPQDNPNATQIIQAYFATHPSLAIRAENWKEKGSRWKHQNPHTPFYIGVQNYILKKPRDQMMLSNEWHQFQN